VQKTKIEWVKNPDGTQGYSWNPIKGLCPIGCWYCYARKIYQRFKLNKELRIELKEFRPIHRLSKPSGIFVCSTMELFHPEIRPEWKERIFATIHELPEHRFYILTKLPQFIDRPMPDNVWIGVSIINHLDLQRWPVLYTDVEAKTKFISFEPWVGPVRMLPNKPDWVIVGRLTGHGKGFAPSREELKYIVDHYKKLRTPIFLKDNLKDIWGEPLIQEMPKK